MKNVKWVILLFVFLTTCTQTPAAVEPTQPTETPQPPKQSTSTSVPTFTEAITATYTSPYESGIIQTECMTVYDEMPADFEVEGLLLVAPDDELPYLENIQSGDRFVFPTMSDNPDNIYQWSIEISPNGMWLVYKEGRVGDTVLWVASADGLEQIPIREGKDWGFGGWFDDEHLMFSRWQAPNGTKVILNPFTGRWQEFLPPPGVFDSYPYPNIYTLYNKDLDRVIYTRDFGSELEPGVALWDISKNEELWHKELFPERIRASWSPDGKLVAITGFDLSANKNYTRIYLVNTAGEEIYSFDLDKDYNLSYIDEIAWSPDGQYIAILFGEGELVLVNVHSGELRNLCVHNEDGYFDASISWAQNSQQFILVSGNWCCEENTRVILVDIEKKLAIYYAHELNVVGWASAPASGQIASSSMVATPQYQGVPTPVPSKRMQQTCANRVTDIKPGLIKSGEIIVSLPSREDRSENILYSLNIQDNQVLLFSPIEEEIIDAAISPNGIWLAYTTQEIKGEDPNTFINLITSDGQQMYKIPWGNRSYWIKGWFGNEQLIFYDSHLDESYLFNPFTEKFSTYSLYKTPDLFIDYFLLNPNQQSAAYIKDEKALTPPELVVWDIENSKELWRLGQWDVLDRELEWSPDGNYLAVAVSVDAQGLRDEIFRVDQDGWVTQMTKLEKAYPFAQIESLSWSPDGRYIAFWADVRHNRQQLQQAPYRLFILNTVDLTVTDTCVSGFYNNNDPPMWSQDSRQLVVEGFLDAENSRVMVVDIWQNWAMEIAQNMNLVGWMISAP